MYEKSFSTFQELVDEFNRINNNPKGLFGKIDSELLHQIADKIKNKLPKEFKDFTPNVLVKIAQQLNEIEQKQIRDFISRCYDMPFTLTPLCFHYAGGIIAFRMAIDFPGLAKESINAAIKYFGNLTAPPSYQIQEYVLSKMWEACHPEPSKKSLSADLTNSTDTPRNKSDKKLDSLKSYQKHIKQQFDVGERLGQFTILEIKRGFFGVVYICNHSQMPGKFALKTISNEKSKDLRIQESFLREAHLWFQLIGYKNFTHAQAFYVIDTAPFLIMDYIKGPDSLNGSNLSDWITKVRPGILKGLELTLCFAIQISNGLRLAREKIKGFVHCDLKPSNILINEYAVVKISDIGLFRVTETKFEKRNNKESGKMDKIFPFGFKNVKYNEKSEHSFKALNQYQSPEVINGNNFSASSDIYALGIMIKEMMESFCSLNESYTPLKNILNEIPFKHELLEILDKCTHQEHKERYQEFNELYQELISYAKKSTPEILEWPMLYNSYDEFISIVFPGNLRFFEHHLGTLDILIPDFISVPAFKEIVKKFHSGSSEIPFLKKAFNEFRRVERLRILEQSIGKVSPFLHLRQPELAKECIDIALDIDPTKEGINGVLAQYYYYKENYLKAAEYYKKEYEFNKDNVILEGIISSLSKSNQINEAMSYLNNGFKNKEDYRYMTLLGGILLQIGQFEIANKLYEEAIEKYPNYILFKYFYYLTLLLIGEEENSQYKISQAREGYKKLNSQYILPDGLKQQFAQFSSEL